MIVDSATVLPNASHIVEGLIGVGATFFTGYQGWQGVMLVRLQRRADAMHTAICGNPQIAGDKGLAGRVEKQEVAQAQINERVGTLEWHLANTVASRDHTHDDES